MEAGAYHRRGTHTGIKGSRHSRQTGREIKGALFPAGRCGLSVTGVTHHPLTTLRSGTEMEESHIPRFSAAGAPSRGKGSDQPAALTPERHGGRHEGGGCPADPNGTCSEWGITDKPPSELAAQPGFAGASALPSFRMVSAVNLQEQPTHRQGRTTSIRGAQLHWFPSSPRFGFSSSGSSAQPCPLRASCPLAPPQGNGHPLEGWSTQPDSDCSAQTRAASQAPSPCLPGSLTHFEFFSRKTLSSGL